MSGRRAKRLRRERLAAGIPANGRTEGPNVLDLDDTREMRRSKTFRKPQIAAEMRDTDPVAWRKKTAFWNHVLTYLMFPAYRDALGAPHRLKGE